MADVLTTPSDAVPFVDLSSVNEAIADELSAEIGALIRTGAFSNGPQVGEFERAFAAYCGAAHCVGMSSGLDALRLSLLAAGIEPGDEVLVPANTFVATFEAVTQAGAVPVPVEVSEADYNIDPEAAEAAVGPRTRFLLPVHLYGQLADMRRLAALAARHDLQIVEDACQAHGGRRDDVRPGELATAAAYSFYPTKNLGAFGDAGAATTQSAEFAATLRALREHGQTRKYHHVRQGYTARLDTIQALVLLKKLEALDEATAGRVHVAQQYSERLAGVGDITLPPIAQGSDPVWHLYVIRTRRREELAEHLAARGVATGRHYPEPAHLSPAYSDLGLGPGSFPLTEALAAETLSLPLFPGMRDHQIERVVDAVRSFFDA